MRPEIKVAVLLKIPEVAKYLQVSEHTVKRRIAAGELRAVKVGPHCYRVDPRDLAKFTEAAKTA